MHRQSVEEQISQSITLYIPTGCLRETKIELSSCYSPRHVLPAEMPGGTQ